MTPEQHTAAIATHAEGLEAAAAAAGLDARVPTCPEWSVRDLVGHLGAVHRWAASFVAEARTEPPRNGDGLERAPADDELLPWFHAGHEQLADVLDKADDTVEC